MRHLLAVHNALYRGLGFEWALQPVIAGVLLACMALQLGDR